MQLLSMEVERRGAGDKIQVAGLSAGLNAVCGHPGSGKTSLLRWLRSVVAPAVAHDVADYATAGRAVLRDHDQEWSISRADFRGPVTNRLANLAVNAWNTAADTHPKDFLNATERAAFERMSAVVSDAAAIDRLWETARALNLDNGLDTVSEDRSRLVHRERELTQELLGFDGLASTREGLTARRRTLEAELDRARRDYRFYRPGAGDHDERRRLEQRLANYQTESQTVRDEINELEAAITRLRNEIVALETQGQLVQASTPKSYRQRLADLDAQLARWRVTLNELRSHRERLETTATDAHLDRQLGDQLSPISHADPRIALRSLEAQILDARRNFDSVMDGFDRRRADLADGHHDMPSMLKSMQKELHEICQQLSRHESMTAGRELREQTQQLSRSEAELRRSIERLIEERGELLREIATAYQMSVDQVAIAYDASCRCSDHPKLDDWLLTQRLDMAGQVPYFDGPQYQSMVDELSRLEQRHKQALAQLEEIQRHYREIDAKLRRMGVTPEVQPVHGRMEADIVRDMDNVDSELRRLETRDRLRVELSELRRRLERSTDAYEDAQSLKALYRRHRQSLGLESTSHANYSVQGSHDAAQVQRLDEVALRLAIMERLAAKGACIPIVLDQTLDNLPSQLRQIAVHHLAHAADSLRRQIVVMTADEQVERSIRDARGTVVPVVHLQSQRKAPDVNSQLAAVANDFEAAKWNEPDLASILQPVQPATKKRFVLTERSQIEDVPSIDRSTAARLRMHGIVRVENLLDADSVELADRLNLDGVTAGMIQQWQAECRLLIAQPHLRPFDVRVLVGAGVHYPRELAELHPSDLHDRVERFLATERGKQIMRSGSSYELSRLTAWLASAKSDAPIRDRSYDRRELDRNGSTLSITGSDRDSIRRKNHDSRRTRREEPTLPLRAAAPVQADVPSDRRRPEGSRKRRGDKPRHAAPAAATQKGAASDHKFYLELASDVVDSPSIGPRMAEQLEPCGVITVEDLLTSDADNLAHDLGIRRISAETIRAWQHQARLVLSIPNLRGHDAQLLVACNITSPEMLARMQPAPLLAQVTAVARSQDGQRILRGSQAPDLAEVTDWIQWAGHSRSIQAA